MHGRAVVLLSFASFASSASQRAIDPLLAPIAQSFGTTAGGAAIASTAFLVAYGLLQLVHGPMGDRFGKYKLVTIHMAISAAGTFACAWAPTLPALAAARFIAGMSMGAVIPLSLAWIGDVVAYERRQAVLAQFMIGGLFGFAFGSAASGLLAEHFGWRWVFGALGVFNLMVSARLGLELRANSPGHAGHNKQAGTMLEGYWRALSLLSRPWVRVMAATVFLEGMLVYGTFAFVPLDLNRRHGLGIGASGAMIGLIALGGLAYAVSANRILPRVGERGLVLLGGLALCTAYLSLASASSAAAAAPWLIVAGAGFYAFHNTLQVNATQMAPEARGSAVSLFAFFLFSGQSLGVWIGGQVVDQWGTRPLFFVASTGLALLALYFRSRLARR
jgi:predicted MFS family arabinose efflux permease